MMLFNFKAYANRFTFFSNFFYLLVFTSIFISCQNVKVGTTVISPLKDKGEINIDNFPIPKYGIEGFNTASYPTDFSFEKVDLTIFNLIRDKGIQSWIESNWSKEYVDIRIRHVYKDKYGKDSSGTWLNIGSISVAESNKYETFADWNREYAIFKMITLLDKKPDTSNKIINADIIPKSQTTVPLQTESTVAEILAQAVLKSTLKIDRDNGLGNIKLGSTFEDIDKFCYQKLPTIIKGKKYLTYTTAIFPQQYYIQGRKAEDVRFIYYKKVLARIIITLPPYDDSVDDSNDASKLRTGNSDVFEALQKQYGPWSSIVDQGKEDEVTNYEEYVIKGQFVELSRTRFELTQQVLDPSQGRLMCPGDRYIYTSIPIQDSINNE
ncbi:hypothetical protein [Pedobacter sp. Leaf41]|uniref:hypothetical protein n=1 Tax=Pedobacter sp. Leaf41 TaxID=1736218 RepID=UPI000AD7CC72|nr:hypothetical protein [Pedobacter sp. Leaf41]